jgi:hypothetical protein
MPTLVEKLAAVVRSVDGVLKVEGDEYSYLRILDLSKAMRDKLFEAGILIIPDDSACEISTRESTITDRQYTSAKICTAFTITDGHEELIFRANGFACTLDDKAVAIAQTAALKSLLKRLSLTFGELDDPEVEHTSEHSLDLNDAEKEWGHDVREWPISRGEVIAFNSACASSGYSKKGIVNYLDSVFGIEVPSKLRRKCLAQAMAWALATGEKPNDSIGTEA